MFGCAGPDSRAAASACPCMSAAVWQGNCGKRLWECWGMFTGGGWRRVYGGDVARKDDEHTEYGNLIHWLQDGTGRERGLRIAPSLTHSLQSRVRCRHQQQKHYSTPAARVLPAVSSHTHHVEHTCDFPLLSHVAVLSTAGTHTHTPPHKHTHNKKPLMKSELWLNHWVTLQ